ncbi:uncharacterized protein LOC131434354 [Malaya genurostris]|uniref:uncharacterized protein LOC131434354 n=1 Tax=Malaya genurostris TaxID=325434 RepID=UPI0026F38E0A|nr:uncharacterized protein LOC131434354 [Malaya genurostris]
MSSELKELKSQQRQIRSTFDGVKQFIQKFKREKHETQIETRLEMLDGAMKEFYTIRRKIDVLTEDHDKKETIDSKEDPDDREARLAVLIQKRESEQSTIIQQAEDTYCELKASLHQLSGKSRTASTSDPAIVQVPATSSAFSKVKLPEIKLPNFSGKIREWVTFRDMFLSLIHRNDQLTDVDKFTYLRSTLGGEALQEISAIEMSAANYTVAWDLLQKRFENKKLIVKAHLDALFTEEPLKREGYDGLNHLLSEYDRNLQMLDKIGENTYNWSTMLVYMVCSRLDSATLRQWESHHCSKEVPTYDELVGFLRNHCAVLQSIAPNKPPQTEVKKSRFTPSHTHTSTGVIRCPFCEESPHSAFKCQKFIKMKVPERYEKVKRCGLCLNCLSPSHLVRFCNKGFCRHCKQKHHSLLHNGAIINGSNGHTPQNNVSATPSQSRPPAANTSQVQPQPQSQTTQSHTTTPATNSLPIAHTDMQSHSHQSFITNHTPSNHINSLTTNSYTSLSQVLLSTAVVHVVDRYGNIQLARALLDSCSEYCFITTNLYKKLYLPESVSYLSVSGIGGSIVKSSKMVEATIAPRSSHISNYLATVKLHVLPKLTSSLPFHPVDIQQLAIPNNIILADPKFNEPGPIDVILGAEYYYDLLTDGRLKLSEGGSTLQQTVFGWIVSGRVNNRNVGVPRTISHPCTTLDLRDILTKIWELE